MAIDHREYIRETQNKALAILMLHGIAGTPSHFRELLPVIPAELSVYNLLLDGHGGSVEDFSATSMKKWKTQVQARLDDLLSKYSKLFIVAHSMGTLFAIQAAIDHPDRIAGLFLLAVPTRPWVRFSTLCTSLEVAFGRSSPKAVAMANASSIRQEPHLYKYIGWLPRMWELLLEIRRVRRLLPQLAVPTLTFQSQVDELVSARSAKDLEGHPSIKNTLLYSSGHFAYSPPDTALLQDRLKTFLKTER